jgi:hypothetical protein
MKIMPFDRIDFYVLCYKNVASQNPSFHGDIDMKKIIFSIFLLILVAGVSGCMKPSPKEEMMKYMQDKYHEEFEFVSINTQVWSAGYVEMRVKSKKFPDEKSIIVRKNKETGVISDNYVDYLMKKPIEDEFNNILSQVYGNYKVFYTPGGTTLPSSASPNMSVYEYSKLIDLPLQVQICVYDNGMSANKDEQLEKLRSLLEAKQYLCQLIVFYMQENKLSEVTDLNKEELSADATESKWAKLRGDFSMDKNYQFRSYRWRELK